MRFHADHCDPCLLDALLAGQLGEAQQEEAARHLESCDSCRYELERRAGDESWWCEASGFLRTDALDPTDDRSATASGSSLADGWGVSELTLDFLEPSDNPAMLGRLGDYEILEVIGRGGMGVVLKGYQRELNRYVAVKVLAPHFASSGAARRRFAREAQAAAAVVHPHVVAIHTVAPTARLPYLVMPYVAAQSLQARLDQNGPLELPEILRIGKQAAEGLAAAHAQGLVHRDVKPANILLEDDVGRVQLTDFGLARAVDDATLTRSGVLAGTPQYMAPEQAHGQPLDHRADLFSLGSVLYAMCTGHSPFRAETTMGILRRICESQPRAIREINPDIPPWLERLVQRLHAKHPDARLQTAEDVARVLEGCLAHVQQPTVVSLPAELAEPQTGSDPGSAFGRAGRRAAVIVLLGASIALAFRAWYPNRPIPPPPHAELEAPEGHAAGQDPSPLAPELDTPTMPSPSVNAWEDGSAELLEQLEHDSSQLERAAMQLWDDPEPTGQDGPSNERIITSGDER